MNNETDYTPPVQEQEPPVHEAAQEPKTTHTPPPPPPPAPPYAAPAAPQNVRRVGTFTMGVCLILAGILAIYGLFNPAVNVLSLLRYAPVVLIALGVEILIVAVFGRNVKLRYDFLSVIVCMLLIGGTLCVSALPYLNRYWGPERDYAENRLEGELYDLCYDKLGNSFPIKTLTLYANIRTQVLDQETTVESITSGDHVHADIDLNKEYDSPLAFAEDCSAIAARLSQTGVPFYQISFVAPGSTTYYLDLRGRYLQNTSAQELVQYVESEVEELPEGDDVQTEFTESDAAAPDDSSEDTAPSQQPESSAAESSAAADSSQLAAA